METLIVRHSRKKLAVLLAADVFVLAVCFCVLYVSRNVWEAFFAWAGLLFFGLSFLYLVYKLLFPKEILFISEKGIEDRSSLTALGFIPWEEVDDVFLSPVGMHRFIEIRLKDGKKIIQKLPFVRRILLRTNTLLGFPVVILSMREVDKSSSEVLEFIKNIRDHHKNL